jgi:superfamily II DNA helicase RecQ
VGPTAVAVVAAGTGWAASQALGENVASALAAAGVALVVYAAGMVLAQRRALADAWGLVTRGRAGTV